MKWSYISLVLLALSSPLPAQMMATVEGDTVRLWDVNFEFGCLASFFPIVRISQDTVYLSEADTAFHAPCRCHYTICTTITGLAPGNYTAVITRELRHYFTSDSVTIHVQDSGVVHFSVAGMSPPSIFFWQSKCLESTATVEEQPTTTSTSLRIHPNPFNPGATITFTLRRSGRVSLSIYSLSGQLLRRLFDGDRSAGSHQVEFVAEGLPSGTYLCRLESGTEVVAQRMVLVK